MISHTVIFADDLTGAADAAAPFVQRGLLSVLCLEIDQPVNADVFSVVTHSRLFSAESAVIQHTAVVDNAQKNGFLNAADWVYHKIDSTLRGYPAQTLNATMDQLGVDQALVTSAFPEQGRQVRQGRVYIHGKALTQSEFGNVIESDNLMTLFEREQRPAILIDLQCVQQGVDAVTEMMQAHPNVIYVADAETRSDLICLATAAHRCDIRLLSGSGGLAGGLASLCIEQDALQMDLPEYTGPILAISGSLHPTMVEQVGAVEASGIARVPTEKKNFEILEDWISCSTHDACQLLTQSLDVLLTTSDLDIGPQSAVISDAVGSVVRQILETVKVGGIFVTGGNVAEAICKALGTTKILLCGQVEEGVVLGRLIDGLCPGLYIVTKAGGFGHKSTTITSIEFLKKL